MTFNSLQYFAFFAVVLVVYWRLGHRAQNVVLLVSSYVFYGAWDWRFLGLLIFTTVFDFGVGTLLGSTDDERRRRILIIASVGMNLLVLGTFKYFNFFVDSFADLMQSFGFDASPPALRIVLPVGISFYTFQTISYTFDVYRRRLEPTRDLLTFAVFVAFFPQLVAGPIERATNLLPQIASPRVRPERATVDHALFMILTGLFKKVVIADSLATAVDATFSAPGQHHWLVLYAGSAAFVAQIYCDFSGYTDIARGSARLLGVELMQNFRQPFFSRNINEYWRRWHISLCTWFFDYVYVPLGGSKGGRARTSFNLVLTMTLAGLWHGPFWPMVMWGTFNGVWMAAHRLWSDRRGGYDAERPVVPADVKLMLGTVGFQAFLAPLFRIQGWDGAIDYMTRIVTFTGGAIDSRVLATIVFGLAATIAVDVATRRARQPRAVLSWSPSLAGGLVGVMGALILVNSGGTPVPFVYFQF